MMNSLTIENITGLVLAGGKGQRMGSEKGLMPFRNQTLVFHALKRLKPQVGFLALNANRHLDDYKKIANSLCVSKGSSIFDQDHVPIWCDLEPDESKGPLAGLLSGLTHCQTDWLALVPCDVPFFPMNLVDRFSLALKEKNNFNNSNNLDQNKENHLHFNHQKSPDYLLAIASSFNQQNNQSDFDQKINAKANYLNENLKMQPTFCLLHRSLRDNLENYLSQGERKVRNWFMQHSFVNIPFFPDDSFSFDNINTLDELKYFNSHNQL